jgi:uncharacterized small protein (DUF1192 family)
VTEEADGLTIAQAAARLNVSPGRLRRILARPQYAAAVQLVAHRTRTGTRTARTVPVTVLAQIREEIGRENSTERTVRAEPLEPFGSRQGGALVARILDEQAARIADLQAQLARLDAQLAAANERESKLLDALARGQAIAAVGPAPPAPAPPQGPAPEQPAGPLRSVPKRAAWWAFWRRKEEGT